MPIPNTADPVSYHANYVSNGCALYWRRQNQLRPIGDPNIKLHYCRYTVGKRWEWIAQTMVDTFNIQDGATIVIVGGGFGWSAEAYKSILPNANIVSTDNSLWVQAEKNNTETADIQQWIAEAGVTGEEADVWLQRFDSGLTRATTPVLDEDLLSPASERRVKNALGLTGSEIADFAISEDVLPWLTDAEAVNLSRGMRNVASGVVHMATPRIENPKHPEPGEPWNWKSRAGWKVVLTPDVIVGPDGRGTL